MNVFPPGLSNHQPSNRLRRRLRQSMVLVSLLLTGGAYSTTAAATAAVTDLRQADFSWGTYIIDQPGTYRLVEDINFRPNSPATLQRAIANGRIPAAMASRLGLPLQGPVPAHLAGTPLFTQFAHGPGAPTGSPGPLTPTYDPAAYGLGFFAAIVIAADDVILDLNGFRIQQSAEHALLQRFFATIELANAPFIPAQGPHDFGQTFTAARRVTVKNGVIGRSAHHGIHGNDNRDVVLRNLRFRGYEVGAITLNGVQRLLVDNVRGQNRKDVPILGTFSSAQFIKPYLAELIRNSDPTTLALNGQVIDAAGASAALTDAINAVHADLIVPVAAGDSRPVIDAAAHPDEYALFHNASGLVDGNSYSFLLNPLGVAVNGFPTRDDANASRGFIFNNVHIRNQAGFINETVALNAGSGPATDPVGAVWQMFNQHPDTGLPITVTEIGPEARYLGNVVANAQALVAKAIHAGAFDDSRLSTQRNSITPAMIRWVEGEAGAQTLAEVLDPQQQFLCNGDSMFHVNKGVIGFKIDGARAGLLNNTSVRGLRNFGRAGSALCGDYSGGKSHPAATLAGYGGAHTRGFSLAGAEAVTLNRTVINDVMAESGNATGLDVLTDTRSVSVIQSRIRRIVAGVDGVSGYAAPNVDPTAAAIRVGISTEQVHIHNLCSSGLNGYAGAEPVADDSGASLQTGSCQ